MIDGDDGAGGGAMDLLGGAGGGAGDGGSGDAGAGAGGEGGAGAGGAGGEGGGGAGDPEWLAQISADAEGESASLRDWMKAKGYKDLNGVAKSLREGERTITTLKASKLSVPGDGASAEEMSAFRTAIGVPVDAKGYEIKAPLSEDGKTPIPLNEPLIARLAEAAHKNGMPKGAFEATVGEYIAAQLDEAAQAAAEQDAKAAGWLKAQGAQKDVKLATVETAARALGLTRTEMQGLRNGLGADRALTLLSRIGEGMSEDILMGGTGTRFDISAAEAQRELDTLNKSTDRSYMTKLGDQTSPEYTRRQRLIGIVARARDRADGITNPAA